MINFKLKFPKRNKKFKKNNTEPNPDIFWITVFSVSIMLIFSFFVFGFLLFSKINQDEVITIPGNNMELEKISKERLDGVLEIFGERKKTSNKIQNSYAPVVDPSL